MLIIQQQIIIHINHYINEHSLNINQVTKQNNKNISVLNIESNFNNNTKQNNTYIKNYNNEESFNYNVKHKKNNHS